MHEITRAATICRCNIRAADKRTLSPCRPHSVDARCNSYPIPLHQTADPFPARRIARNQRYRKQKQRIRNSGTQEWSARTRDIECKTASVATSEREASEFQRTNGCGGGRARHVEAKACRPQRRRNSAKRCRGGCVSRRSSPARRRISPAMMPASSPRCYNGANVARSKADVGEAVLSRSSLAAAFSSVHRDNG
jgi:hypothetical protein